MKKIILLLLLAFPYLAGNSQARVIWTCPMHPQIKMEKPGKCPICGMTLVKKTIRVAPAKSATGEMEPMKTPKDTMSLKNDMEEMDMKNDGIDTTGRRDHPAAKDTNAIDIANLIQSKVYVIPGKTVRYDLYVTDTMVNFTGRKKHAYAINGTIPGPALVFTEGDTAEIYLHNKLRKEETSLHWHGVVLPNEADGVPYLTTARIPPRGTHLYKFAVVQNGTYWYHSHTKLQEQAGMYGALIFKKRDEVDASMHPEHGSMNMRDRLFDVEYPIVLSEWTDEKPSQVQRRLRSGTDWYAIKKRSVQSYSESIGAGHLTTKLNNEWKRMKSMDVSDVYYDRFLINGKPDITATQFKAGDRIKLRVVNAGATSYFWLQYAGGKITVVANDGNEVEPVDVDRLIIGVAETYDLIVTVQDGMSDEFRITPEDRTNAASLWLGSGKKMRAPVLPRLKYFEGMKMMNSMMKMNGDMNDMGMQMSNQKMDMNMVMYPEMSVGQETDSIPQMKQPAHDQHADSMNMHDVSGTGMRSGMTTLNYTMLRSPVKTVLPDTAYKELHFTLTGNMNRYVWSINNKTINEWDKIFIEKGKNVRIILFNNSMMRHPMHLHGHDFRLLNDQGEYAPLKNVVDIMPMETDTLEFAANHDGNWFFHCHILYHMMAGMGNILRYTNSLVNPELPDTTAAFKTFRRDNQMIHPMAKIGLESNGSDGDFMLNSNRFALQGLWHLGYMPHHGYETEINFGRYIGRMQWWFPYVGFDYHYKQVDGMEKDHSDYKNLFGQVSNKNDRKTFVIGVQYTLPWLVVADARVDGDGKLRFQLGREDIPITPRLRFTFMGNTDKEYMAGFRYIVQKWLSLSTHYDSDMGLGAGITIIY